MQPLVFVLCICVVVFCVLCFCCVLLCFNQIPPHKKNTSNDRLSRVGNHERLLQLQHEIEREFDLIKMVNKLTKQSKIRIKIKSDQDKNKKTNQITPN